MQVNVHTRSWSPSRRFFWWFPAISGALVLTVSAGWVMLGASVLALLHITGTAGPMHVADYSLGFVGLGVVAAMIMFGVAAPYSMTAHLSKGVVVSTTGGPHTRHRRHPRRCHLGRVRRTNRQ
ncbi:hypothetical protein NWF34_11885 [Gordonia sp. GONU]|uniref:hypothetical protein n=1 Tax=Gordonia sp. GONU TaxID=2972949 RepID=UPI0021AC7E22|nr:hypothetical protein [Gordonia sp. GONU]MCR8897644.1 hypothetical protein [Gordonia sp. GONU]